MRNAPAGATAPGNSPPVLMAQLRPQLIWRKTSPSAENPDGPVLYQIIFRSSATPNHIPRIAPNFTLTNSLISDNGSQVAIGSLSISSTGIITFNGAQTFPGSVNSVTSGNSFITIGGTATNPTVALNTANTDARYLQLSGGTMTGPITFFAGQTFPGTGTVTSVNTGAGLTGGPITGTGSISIAAAGVTNTMLANPSVTLNTGSGLSGGGTLALGGSLTLANTGVLSVGASSPLASSGGATPSISLTGIVPIANGGTGISTAPSTAAQYLRSSGAGAWAIGNIQAGDVPSLSGTYVDLVSDQTIAGNKIFNNTISGNISGNAATATSATTAATATNALALGGNPAASYKTTALNDLRYLQLAGGTLTGGLVLGATGTATAIAGNNSNPTDWTASVFNSGTTAESQTFRWQTEPVGNNTPSPSGSLSLLFSGTGNGFTPTETGLSVASNGRISFAPGQVFPVSGLPPAGGDASGTLSNLTVVALQGTPVASVTPASGQVLKFDGTKWAPAAASAGTVTNVSGTAPLTVTNGATTPNISLAAGGITNSLLANPSLTVSPGSGLTGGGSVNLGGSTTLSIANAGVTNAMLANPALTVSAGSGLTGGGSVALGGSTTLNLDTTFTDTRYLQLSGGTLTGGLFGTTASFNSNIQTGGALSVPIPNEGTTGTVVNQLVELTGAPVTAINAGIDLSVGTIGVVIDGAGTSGSAQVALLGAANCVFDGPTVAGHYVIKSITTGGDCHDSSATTYPTGVQVIGRAISTSDGGTSQVALFPPEERSSGGTVTSVAAGDSSITIAGTAAAPTVAVNGAAVTNLNASNLASGTVPTGRLSGSYSIDISGNASTATSATTATTATNALALGGNSAASYKTTAQNDLRYLQLSGGTLTGALSGTTASFSGNISSTGGVFNGDGSGLTNLNASNLNSGTVPSGRLSGSYGIDISGNAATATSATTAATATNALALGGNSAVSYNTTAQNDTRYLQLSGGTLTGGLVGTTANFSSDVETSGALSVTATNEGTTGTFVNQLVELTGAPSTVINASTSTTAGTIGVVIGGAGTSGSAQVAIAGSAGCVFDGGTTAGDYVVKSTTTGGDCHDAGATYPTGVQVIGRALKTNASAVTSRIALFSAEERSSGGTVTSVSASAPLSSSGGVTPSISLTGVIPGGNLPLTTSSTDTTAGHLVQGNDTRLSDSRVAASVNFATATLSGTVPGANLPLTTSSTDTTAGHLVQGNDTRLSDSRAAASVNFGTAVLSGTVPTANGGTGQSSSGAAGNYLRSDGSVWQSSAIQAADVPSLSGTVYDASGTKLSSAHTVSQQATLGGGGSVTQTFSGSAAFSSATSYDCVARDITASGTTISVTYTSGTSITLSGGILSGGNSVHYACVGN